MKLLSLAAVFLVPGFATAFVAPRRLLRPPTTTRPAFMTHFEELGVPTGRGVSMVDITADIKDIVAKCGCKEGVVTVISKHSTCSIMLNEWEVRHSDATLVSNS